MRGERPFQFCSLRDGIGMPEVIAFLETAGGLIQPDATDAQMRNSTLPRGGVNGP